MTTQDVRINAKNSDQPKTQPTQGESAPMHNNFLTSARRTARATSPAPVNMLMGVLKQHVQESPDLKDLQIMAYVGSKDGSNLSGVACYLEIGGACIMHFIASEQACELHNRDVAVGNGHNNTKVSFPTFVADLYHSKTIAYIRKDIIRNSKTVTSDTKFLNAGMTVLRHKHTAPEFADVASNYANIALDAIHDFAAHCRLKQEELFDVSVLKGHMPKAQVTVEPGDNLTIDNIPRRADLSVSVYAQIQGSEGIVPVEITRACGFMNFIYRTPKNPAMLAPGQIPSQEHFLPEVVITEATAIGHATTLESYLYAIYSIDSVIDQHRWLNLYKYNRAGSGKNAVDEYNLGALNIDLPNIGNKDIDDRIIPTGDPAWIEKGLYQFASTYFTKTIGKAIDIPESGPTARLASLLRASVVVDGMSDEARAKAKMARAQVVEAADNLTGGRFSAKLGTNDLFLPMIERTIIGTYVEDGVRKDINHLDHVAMLNLFGEKASDIVYRYEATFTDLHVPEVERLKDRMDIVRQVKGSSVENLELGYRLRWTPQAQIALAKSISENNVHLHIDGAGSVDAQPERGAGYLDVGYGVGADTVSGFDHGAAGGMGSNYGRSYDW